MAMDTHALLCRGYPLLHCEHISVILFTRMGVPNGEMALFTSLIYSLGLLNLCGAPLSTSFAPSVWWIIMMQIVMSIAFILLTFSIPHPSPEMISATATPVSLFSFTLILFVITAFASATHDIAADGFYMLALNQQQQSFFVGIRSTFYRLSSIFGQGRVGLRSRRARNPNWQHSMGLDHYHGHHGRDV